MNDWSAIGTLLRTTRCDLGWSLQDVAHRTRIPVRTLHGLEENDYADFPSAAYGKSFLAQYSEHLGIDATEWLDAFETGDVLANLDSYDYLKDHDEHLGEPPEEVPRREPRKARRTPVAAAPASPVSVGGMQPLLIFTVTAVLITGVVFGFMHLSEELGEASVNRKSARLSPVAADESDLQPLSSIPDTRTATLDTSNIPRAVAVSPDSPVAVAVAVAVPIAPLGAAPGPATPVPGKESPLPPAVVIDSNTPRAIIVDP